VLLSFYTKRFIEEVTGWDDKSGPLTRPSPQGREEKRLAMQWCVGVVAVEGRRWPPI